MNKRISIIYTGGTLGMGYHQNDRNSYLEPKSLQELLLHLPDITDISPQDQFQPNDASLQAILSAEVLRGSYDAMQLDFYSFAAPLDSSDVTSNEWQVMANLISAQFESYDGFFILHGTDTLAYTASALQVMLQNLSKPVLITGASLPISELGSNARDNIIDGLKLLGSSDFNGVWVCYDGELMPGDKCSKTGYNSPFFDCPKSPEKLKLPLLALGSIKPQEAFACKAELDSRVVVIYYTPSLSLSYLAQVLALDDHSFILLGYGPGNFVTSTDFKKLILDAIDNGKTIAIMSQTYGGVVDLGHYATSLSHLSTKIINLHSHTIESALTKLMWAKANLESPAIKEFMEAR